MAALAAAVPGRSFGFGSSRSRRHGGGGGGTAGAKAAGGGGDGSPRDSGREGSPTTVPLHRWSGRSARSARGSYEGSSAEESAEEGDELCEMTTELTVTLKPQGSEVPHEPWWNRISPDCILEESSRLRSVPRRSPQITSDHVAMPTMPRRCTHSSQLHARRSSTRGWPSNGLMRRWWAPGWPRPPRR